MSSLAHLGQFRVFPSCRIFHAKMWSHHGHLNFEINCAAADEVVLSNEILSFKTSSSQCGHFIQRCPCKSFLFPMGFPQLGHKNCSDNCFIYLLLMPLPLFFYCLFFSSNVSFAPKSESPTASAKECHPCRRDGQVPQMFAPDAPFLEWHSS